MHSGGGAGGASAHRGGADPCARGAPASKEGICCTGTGRLLEADAHLGGEDRRRLHVPWDWLVSSPEAGTGKVTQGFSWGRREVLGTGGGGRGRCTILTEKALSTTKLHT